MLPCREIKVGFTVPSGSKVPLGLGLADQSGKLVQLQRDNGVWQVARAATEGVREDLLPEGPFGKKDVSEGRRR